MINLSSKVLERSTAGAMRGRLRDSAVPVPVRGNDVLAAGASESAGPEGTPRTTRPRSSPSPFWPASSADPPGWGPCATTFCDGRLASSPFARAVAQNVTQNGNKSAEGKEVHPSAGVVTRCFNTGRPLTGDPLTPNSRLYNSPRLYRVDTNGLPGRSRHTLRTYASPRPMPRPWCLSLPGSPSRARSTLAFRSSSS